ncbi:HEAT repeat domain-containing protein [Ferrimonas sp. SCSIO 43195]|uniref:HEAT repeat domain-containing protein n=1 Tax=Ferrimonas sp. SCSIO 43195 TaxID=2822844 RepID=UPI002075B1AD|nr:HEAT repeat domain-containing protein [Ferrimonas sp. SCSIO 43195]USD37551.1 HEAT repeat domain-containing protein [Ferrimonas sp. SCSIO 43195]
MNILKSILLLCMVSCSSSASVPPKQYDEVVNSLVDASATYESMVNKSFADSPASAFSRKLSSVINALNNNWSMESAKYYSTFLIKLWDMDESFTKKIDPYVLNHPKIRLEVARLIGQANKICAIDFDAIVIGDYVRSNLYNPNPSIQLSAIRALGAVGNGQDVEALLGIVLEERNGFAEHAASSLDLLHDKGAYSALKSAVKQVKREGLKKYIAEINEYYDGTIRLSEGGCTNNKDSKDRF